MMSLFCSFTIAYAAISSLSSGLYLKYFPRFDLSSFVAANKAFTADTVVSVISWNQLKPDFRLWTSKKYMVKLLNKTK